MNTNTPRAMPASSTNQAMFASMTGHAARRVRTSARVLALSALALLGSCATPPPPAPVVGAPPPVATAPATKPGLGASPSATHARWVPAAWSDLPGWQADATSALWPALRRNCERLAAPSAGATGAAWAGVCRQARSAPPMDDAQTRLWLIQRLQPYRVEAHDGNAQGLATGYFEPLLAATRSARPPPAAPAHAAPPDLASRQPYWTRQQLDTDPAAAASLSGREIAWLDDPMSLLLLQIQGSGRLSLTEADGSTRMVRLAFAGHNGQPYRSVGRWLIDAGELRPSEATWPGIRDWAQRHPERVQELLWRNPRVVFFREEPLPDPSLGPRGAFGVPLTPGRSVAVDPAAVPLGTLLWLDTTEPLSATPLQRLVLAQDTGSAITGAVRIDYFWGWEGDAETQAGRMKQPLRVWALWPVGAAVPGGG